MQFKSGRNLLLLVIMLVFTTGCTGQDSAFRSFFTLTPPVRWWVIKHPVYGKKAFDISREAGIVSRSMEPLLGDDYQGGPIDAFRHAYWMARLVQEIPHEKALELGIVHEKGSYHLFKKGKLEDGAVADKAASIMDLWNNEAGYRIGITNPDSEKNELIKYIVDALAGGELRIMNKQGKDIWLSEDGRILTAPELEKWENEKSMIPSILP